MAHFVFPAAKKNDSQIKHKKEKTSSKITPISDQANNNQNSEQINTKFEETCGAQKNLRREAQSWKEQRKSRRPQQLQQQKMKGRRADAQREVRDAATTNPTSVKDNPFNKIRIEAAAATTTKKMKGPSQKTLKEKSVTPSQPDCETRR